MLEYDKMADTDTVDEFIAFVRESLCYLTAVTRNQGTRDGVDGVDPAAVKFWKSALHKVYDILDKVRGVLERNDGIILKKYRIFLCNYSSIYI